MANDPVCGMDADPKHAAATRGHRGDANGGTPVKRTADGRATERTRRRYDRSARYYDALEWLAERRVARWRRSLWAGIQGPLVLELGVGTGKNIPYYPSGARLTAIDLAPRMLERARRRAAAQGRHVDLQLGDAQALDFPDHCFDDVVATFVFCSVPDPVQGLREARRVLKPGGRLHLIEHVRAPNRAAGWLMDRLNPVAVRLTGANINRDTVGNVRRAGFSLDEVRSLGIRGLVTRISASPPAQATPS